MADPALRQIKIQTGVLKRLGKERTINHKEVAQQAKRIETFKAEGRDEYDIKKQFEVLDECKMMIPHTQEQLNKAWAKLDGLLTSNEHLKEAVEYKEAKEMLAAVSVEDPEAL